MSAVNFIICAIDFQGKRKKSSRGKSEIKFTEARKISVQKAADISNDRTAAFFITSECYRSTLSFSRTNVYFDHLLFEL